MPTPTQIVIGGSSVTWSELTDSDSGEVNFNAPSSQRKWLVTGTLDVDDLINSAPNNIPSINIRGNVTHFFRGYRYEPTQPGNGNSWIVTATFGFEVEYFELSFDTSGETMKVMVALDDGDYYNCETAGNPGALTPSLQGTADFNRLIGVNGDKVDGVDIPTSKFDFTVLVRNKFATLPSTYINTLADLTGCTNKTALAINWKGQVFTFGVEELLFLGVCGKMTSEDGFEVTLKFSKQKSTGSGALTSANYTQPAVGQTVTIETSATTASTFFTVGDTIYVAGAGRYTVIAVDTPTANDILALNLGYTGDGTTVASPGATISSGAAMSSDSSPPLVIGNSSPIAKRGHRYVWVNTDYRESNGRRILTPLVAVVNKVIPTADLNAIGIFSEVPP